MVPSEIKKQLWDELRASGLSVSETRSKITEFFAGQFEEVEVDPARGPRPARTVNSIKSDISKTEADVFIAANKAV